nr:MFS transporter [Arthrobacter stackebrandtii]
MKTIDPAVPLPVRRARVAVAALFLTNGALFANLLPRFPEIKAMLGLDNAGFGLAAAAFPLGAMLAGLAAGALIRRFGSARVAVAGTVLTALALACAGMAPTGLLFAAGMGIAGAMDAITDVGQNSHGLRVQKLFGRSILNSFHAVWSMGAVLGGLMGAAAAGLGVPVPLHLAVSGALFAAVSLCSLRFLLPGAGEAGAETAPAGEASDGARPARAGGATSRFSGRGKYLVLLALVLVAAAGSLVEDAGNTWAALYLRDGFGAPASIAGLGFVALVGAQFVGRLVGDRLVDRFGERLVAQAGGALVALGMGLALLFPSLPGSIAGFAAAGFGIATLVPAAMHGADNIPGLRPGTGLTVLSWLMRISFLLSPPVVGAIADATSLRTGLWVVPLAGIMVLALSPVLAGKRAAGRG